MNSVPAISAYVPCYNNHQTVAVAVESLQRQTLPPRQVFVLDDGSTDGSPDVVSKLEVPVVRQDRNSGRGAVRARAMLEAEHDLVLSCDATTRLPPDFVEKALPWLAEPLVAGVFGRLTQDSSGTLADRWRGRHLLKCGENRPLERRALLSTWGCLLRKSAVLQAGNFNPQFRHSEDAELGQRLLAAGYQVIFDPHLEGICITSNPLGKVLERYWRWYAGTDETVSWRGYFKQMVYAFKVMAARDLRDHDWASVPVSLFVPHYQFWKSKLRNRNHSLKS